ncbi:MAG: hypothetical protein PQ964_01690 [Methanobacteriaceae archaeon]
MLELTIESVIETVRRLTIWTLLWVLFFLLRDKLPLKESIIKGLCWGIVFTGSVYAFGHLPVYNNEINIINTVIGTGIVTSIASFFLSIVDRYYKHELNLKDSIIDGLIVGIIVAITLPITVLIIEKLLQTFQYFL